MAGEGRNQRLGKREPAAAGLLRIIRAGLTAVRDEFMPVEPPELELGVVELADGAAALAVILRPDVHARGTGLADISNYGGWRAYLEQR